MYRTNIIGEDTFDSRDVIKRIEELEAIENPDVDEAEELKALKEFADEAEGYTGAQFILDSYFEEYAINFASEIGRIQDEVEWPYNHIDWKAAAEDLQQDYSSVDLGEFTYWVR